MCILSMLIMLQFTIIVIIAVSVTFSASFQLLAVSGTLGSATGRASGL